MRLLSVLSRAFGDQYDPYSRAVDESVEAQALLALDLRFLRASRDLLIATAHVGDLAGNEQLDAMAQSHVAGAPNPMTDDDDDADHMDHLLVNTSILLECEDNEAELING